MIFENFIYNLFFEIFIEQLNKIIFQIQYILTKNNVCTI